MNNPYAPPQTDSSYLPIQQRIDPAEAEVIGRRIAKMNRRSLFLGASGLLLQGMGRTQSGLLGAAMVLVGMGLLVAGLSYYARMRGWSGWFGLLGVLSCIGIVALLCLPKHCHHCRTTVKEPTCPNCGAPSPK